MNLETRKFDAAEYLETEDDIRIFLADAFEDGDPRAIKAALNTVARARGMSQVAKDAGVSRTGLYKALSDTGNPSLDNLASILRSFGLKLTVSEN